VGTPFEADTPLFIDEPVSINELVDPSWSETLASQRENLAKLNEFLQQENVAGRPWIPASDKVLRAFMMPMDMVRVVIIGQDPYPTPGHAVGLSFSVGNEVDPPRSLINIFKELEADLGCPRPTSGDLTQWADQGVLLLNRVLTVGTGQSGSHRGRGWEEFTETAVRRLAEISPNPPVFMLWGKDAQSCRALLGDAPVIESAHPSPLSANRGFFGSRPFSKVNQLLLERGQEPISWCVD
jgi:uracil-DNA glycosylase